jgi:hypothetical protein
MSIVEVEVWRDGGTITFKLVDSPSSGYYRLQTPWRGEPRPLFREDQQLEFGSAEEANVLAALEIWFGDSLTPELSSSLDELDRLQIWLNLPERLSHAVSLHRIRTVIRCLQARAA